MSKMKSFKEIAEDVYAADRKEKQWVDPATGKTKKRSIQAHRIQFAASKLHKAADEKDATPDYLLPQDERKQQKEEHMEELKSELFEVLSKDAAAADWIHDFVHSDNPKFAGKSKKERVKMALGAYYAKQRNEEVDLEEGVNDRPKATEKKSTEPSGVPFDGPYKTTFKKAHNPNRTGMDAARALAQKAMKAVKEEKYKGLEAEDKPGKVKTAVVKLHPKGVESETVEGWKDSKKPVKESHEEGTSMSKTYSQFIEELFEGMTATQVRPGVTRYTGGSYGNAKGAKYGNTDYDNETLDKKDDEGSEEQVKRGRGRPAGSKSGARGPRIK